MTPAPDHGTEASVPARSMFATLRGVTTVVAPTSLVTALLFYFGWARTSTQASVMGLDESLFGYSTRDYILRSITTMFWPLFDAALAVLVALLFHARLVAWLGVGGPAPRVRNDRRRAARDIGIGFASVGAILLVLGGVGSRVEHPSRFVSLGAPLAVTTSIVVLAYAAYLRQLVAASDNDPQDQAASGLAAMLWGTVTVLLLLGSFWTVSHYAAIKGIDFAHSAVRRLPMQPSVTIYSERRLFLEPPVTEEALPGGEGTYRYKYAGLRLLFRADDRLFLRPSDLSDHRNIVIAENESIRVEYT